MPVKQCIKCGEINKASLESCSNCKLSLSDAILIKSDNISITANPKVITSPKGIGGWLVLVIFGLVVSIIRIAITLFNSYVPLLSSDVLKTLSTPGNKYYSQFWIPFITFEALGNIIIALICIIALILLFTKKKSFPTIMIIFYIFNLLFIVFDTVLYSKVKPHANITSEQSVEILRQFLTCCIWIPYFCLSRRVKNTFIK